MAQKNDDHTDGALSNARSILKDFYKEVKRDHTFRALRNGTLAPPRSRGPPHSPRQERRRNSHGSHTCHPDHHHQEQCYYQMYLQWQLVAGAEDKCTGEPQHYFATITDENGEDVQKVLGAMYCPLYAPCERPVRLVTRTAEVLNDLSTQFNVCGDTTPTDDTGPFRTKSNVFIGVDTDTCELKTFAAPLTLTESTSRYLPEVTVNYCSDCNPTTTVYWAGRASEDKDLNYYMIPNQGGEVGVNRDSNSSRTIESFRKWNRVAVTE